MQLDFGAFLMRRPGADPILEEVARGGSRFERVVLTRNRRVMVSVGERGRVLRLHESFAHAPLEVLRAVGGLLAPRRSGRARSRAVVRQFIAGIPTPGPRNRHRQVRPSDRPAIARLQEEFDRVNGAWFAGELPSVPIFLSGRMRSRNGHFCADPLEIVISRALCERADPGEAESTLRHEIIHLWQHHTGRRPDHGPEFRRWARRLGVHPRATRVVGWTRNP